MIYCRQQPKRYGGDGGSSSGGGGSGEDVGKLTRKRLNRGLPGRKQGTVRIQVGVLCMPMAAPKAGEAGSEDTRSRVHSSRLGNPYVGFLHQLWCSPIGLLSMVHTSTRLVIIAKLALVDLKGFCSNLTLSR